MSVDVHAFNRALGVAVKQARQGAGFSRRDLAAAMQCHGRTLAAYEQGDRALTAVRLWEICTTIGAPAPDVYRTAIVRAEVAADPSILWVDVRALLLLTDPPAAIPTIPLTPRALHEIATITGRTTDEVITTLRRFTPHSTTEQIREAE